MNGKALPQGMYMLNIKALSFNDSKVMANVNVFIYVGQVLGSRSQGQNFGMECTCEK